MIRTPLPRSHVEALRAAGKVVTYPKGTIMAQQGEKANRFVYVEEGEIEVVNPFTGERHYPSTIGPTQFMGEISLLYGGTAVQQADLPHKLSWPNGRRIMALASERINYFNLAFLDVNEAVRLFALVHHDRALGIRQ